MKNSYIFNTLFFCALFCLCSCSDDDGSLPTVPGTNDVVDYIVNSNTHTTLESAIIAAELDDDLRGDGPFTVFAPTDNAFAALPAGTLETLLMNPTGDLANILLNHVLAANLMSTDLSDGMMSTSLSGDDLTVSITADGIFINDAKVVVANVMLDNGMVHVIDAVILPASTSYETIPVGQMAMSYNNEDWQSTTVTGISSSAVSTITAEGGLNLVFLVLASTNQGTYPLGGSNLTSVTVRNLIASEDFTSSNEGNASGEFIIQENNTTDKTISGSFSAVVINDNGDSRTITKGLFNQIPYSQ